MDLTTNEGQDSVITSTTKVVDQLRQRIDHLMVQIDLGTLDARDEAVKQLDVAQNACLAAVSRLRDAGHDLAATSEALRDGVEQLVRDVKKAIDAADAVRKRG
jgi:hypothetical protein